MDRFLIAQNGGSLMRNHLKSFDVNLVIFILQLYQQIRGGNKCCPVLWR